MDLKLLLDEVEQMRQAVRSFPAHWDGRTAILEMREAGSKHWRQTEWMGWYHEFLCEKHLGAVLDLPGPTYGNSTLDAEKTIAWDFKCHAANSTRNDIITNHTEAVTSAIRDYGRYGIVLALGIVEYNDEERTFKQWHQQLGGGPSEYTLRRIARGAMSRRRKTEFVLSEIHFVCLDEQHLEECGGTFQKNFRNADGSPRNEKVSLDLRKLPDEAILATVEFAAPSSVD